MTVKNLQNQINPIFIKSINSFFKKNENKIGLNYNELIEIFKNLENKKNNLMKLKKNQLVEKCKKLGYEWNGNKKQLINNILYKNIKQKNKTQKIILMLK